MRSRPPHRPRRQHPGLWAITVLLVAILVATLLFGRDLRGDRTELAGADSPPVAAAVNEATTADTTSSGKARDRDGDSPGADGGSGGADRGSGDTAQEAKAERAAAAKRARDQRAAQQRLFRPTVANGLDCRPRRDQPVFVRHADRERDRRIALTFDDGPSKYTGPLLDTLRARKVPATFFVIGSQVGTHRALMRRIVGEGHALGNHTWSHANVSGGGTLASNQLLDTQYAIEQAVGSAGCLMRPPGGVVGPRLQRWLREHRKVGVMWDVDSHDYQRPSSATMVSSIVGATRPGSIILMHDGGGDRASTLAAVPGIIKRLKARGYTFVTVPELLRLPEAKR